jgi:NTP pyrophosphatase (non-canonical NTP hydrolase)
MMNIQQLCQLAHERSVAAGWWNDLETGRPLMENKSIVPEKLCLIHSEISEANVGFEYNLMDDKLPHRTMVEVELADAMIRLGDLCGALGIALEDVVNDLRRGDPSNLIQPHNGYYKAVSQIHGHISQAMEGHRKGLPHKTIRNRSQLEVGLAKVCLSILQLAGMLGCDVWAAIEEKMAFNAVRPDHKIENRLKDGGKKF